MERKFGDKLNDLDLTNDEIKRLSECMKDEKFMDLLRDYAMEISNPENKKKYEEEIAMLERERGNNVKFIHPLPGHVLKTSQNGENKCFINICSSPEVGKPVSKPTVKGSTRGMQWSIPHSLSQPREDTDKAGARCMVYDVVFNPDTYHMAQKNGRFRKMIHDMALDAVERLFHVNLDKVNIKKPKMTFKGLPQASIIRTPSEDTRELDVKSAEDPDDPLRFPYPPMSNAQARTDGKLNTGKENNPVKDTDGSEADNTCPEFVEPNYTLTHRGYFDMKDYYTIPDYDIATTRPRELVLNIELPMLKAASALHLEIFEEQVFLECAKPVKYKLDLKLPYPVDDSKGHARFDKSKRKLTITLEVLPPKIRHVLTFPREENDNACGSCSQENEDRESQEEKKEGVEEQCPSENEESDHPSGLIHGKSRCRHQNHGSLWGESYERNTSNKSDFGVLSNSSPSLVKILSAGFSPESKTPPVKKRPKILYHQDETFVTVIIDVKLIDGEKLWYTVLPDNVQLCCVSEDSKLDVVYQLFVKFQSGEIVDPQRSRVDVSDDNAVFLLRKHISSEHEWQTFEAGFDSFHLKRLSFATEANVNNLISAVMKEAQNSTTREFDCEDVSGGQNSELLVLKLLPKEVVDEPHLPEKKKQNGTQPDELPLMRETLQKIGELDKDTDRSGKPDHEKLLKAANSRKPLPPEAETDEDDDSDTYETADSSEEDSQNQSVEGFPKSFRDRTEIADTDERELNSSLGGKMQGNLSLTEKPRPHSPNDGTGMIKGLGNTAQQVLSMSTGPAIANEPLVVHEYDKGSESKGKTKVVTDHKTKSVIRLNNEMLFEIDSD